MTFKLTKNIDATITTQDGLVLGVQNINVDITYQITKVFITIEGSGFALLSMSINGGSPDYGVLYPFTYELNSPIFSQAETQIMALNEFVGAIVK
jgi:hypothetical protein